MTDKLEPINTREEAMHQAQRLIQLHQRLRRTAMLDVFAEATDRSIALLENDLDYWAGITDERFAEQLPEHRWPAWSLPSTPASRCWTTNCSARSWTWLHPSMA